jgi:hypothetical protein
VVRVCALDWVWLTVGTGCELLRTQQRNFRLKRRGIPSLAERPQSSQEGLYSIEIVWFKSGDLFSHSLIFHSAFMLPCVLVITLCYVPVRSTGQATGAKRYELRCGCLGRCSSDPPRQSLPTERDVMRYSPMRLMLHTFVERKKKK